MSHTTFVPTLPRSVEWLSSAIESLASLERSQDMGEEARQRIAEVGVNLKRQLEQVCGTDPDDADEQRQGESAMGERVGTIYVPSGKVLYDREENRLSISLEEPQGPTACDEKTVEEMNRMLKRRSLVDAFGRTVPLQEPTSDEVLDALAVLLQSRTTGGLVMQHLSRLFLKSHP